MKKVLALDIGDVWTGTALSDELKMLARPYKTVKTVDLRKFLTDLLSQEPIEKIVVGEPRTMKGRNSEQTKKTQEFKNKLEEEFQTVSWILWDERLTSKRAQAVQRKGRKVDKQHEHSVAAAFILDSYLEYCRIHTVQ